MESVVESAEVKWAGLQPGGIALPSLLYFVNSTVLDWNLRVAFKFVELSQEVAMAYHTPGIPVTRLNAGTARGKK